MGGKDVIYMKQQHSSTLQPSEPSEVQKSLKEMADKRFSETIAQYGMGSERLYNNDKVSDI